MTMSTGTPEEIPIASTSRAQSPQMVTSSAIAQLAESIAAITILSPPQAPTASTSKLNPLSAPYVPTGLLVPTAVDSAEPEADAQIIEALKSAKDRIYVLKLGESFESLINERATRFRLDCSAQTTYQRLLVRRCAAYHRLQIEQHPETKVLTVIVVDASRIPVRRLSDLVPTLTPPEPAAPTIRIMRRGDTAPTTRSNSESADASDTESVHSQAQKNHRTALTIEQREAAYNAARERIFNKSLQAPSIAGTSIASTATDEAESVDGAATESEITTLSTCSTSDLERGRSKSSASASPRGRKGRGRSTSPEYVPYDPVQHGTDLHGSPPSPPIDEIPDAPSSDGGQYTQYGAVYTPASYPMYAMYPQGQNQPPPPPQSFFQYPPSRQDQPQQQSAPVYGPQFVYGPYGWINPPPAQQQVQNGQYQQPPPPPSQNQQQFAYPAAAPAAQFGGAQPSQYSSQPYLTAVVPQAQQQLPLQMPPQAPQPQPIYGPPQALSTQAVQQLQFGTAPPAHAQAFIPPPAGAPHPPVAINGSTAIFVQQQPHQQPPSQPPQQQQQFQAYPVLQNGFVQPQYIHTGNVPPPQQQPVFVSHSHQVNGQTIYRPSAPPQPYGVPQHQQHFESSDGPYNQHQGPIQFGHATPFYGGKEYAINGSVIPRGGSGTVGPRMSRRAASSSSSIATSASSSASGGARTPADETASVASSVASSSSSSSRKTYTSTASGTHPLPARPDWAIGMKPSPPSRHTGLPRHHQHHHNQQRSRAPQFGNADFPPLSGSHGSGSGARGAWARPMPMARMEYERPPAKGDVELYNPRSGNKASSGGFTALKASEEGSRAEYTEVAHGTDSSGSGSGGEQPTQGTAGCDGVSAT